MTDYTYKIDDKLSALLLEHFNTDEQQQFVENFKLYLQYGQDHVDSFVIDLDNVWEWVGFLTKGNAKRHLQKMFDNGTDYCIQNTLCTQDKRVHPTHGGQNKETIMLTVNAFKALCMTANTDKGKKTTKYYAKMEYIFWKYLEAKNQDNINIMKKEFKLKLQLEKHNNLKTVYKDTPCVYVFKVSEVDDNNFIVKLGETDNIQKRIISIKQDYNDCILLDVFPCSTPHKFEQYLLNKKDIKERRIPGTELLKIDDTYTYKQLLSTIQKNITYFNKELKEDDQETIRLKLARDLLQAYMDSTNEERKLFFLNEYKKILNKSDTKLDVETDNDIVHESVSFKYHVFQYNPDNLTTPIATYPSLREAARSLGNNKMHDYHIRDASDNNTMLEGYRWYYIDNEKEVPTVIPPTKEIIKTPSFRKGLVAQISKDKQQIINIYGNQSEAAIAVKKSSASITLAISRSSMSAGYYWKMYDDCNDSLKSSFIGPLPEPKISTTSSKKIEKIDPETKKVLAIYSSIQDVCTEFRTSHKTINKKCETGDIYNGFIWKFVNT
jgi:phage anti-repressor protein